LPAEDQSDEALVARAHAGDGTAFHELVERHQGPLLGAIRGRLPDPEAARDVFQETWVRALERLSSLREPRRLRSYLVSIAFNLCRERGRGRPGASLEEALAAGAAPPLDPGAPVGEELERTEELARVRAAVAALPPRQRQVVELRAAADLSHADIARVLGITEENARANLYQGLKRLRAVLRGSEDGEPDS
jgi:RNA polymerase sigma-70 factor (ECF subfamily)